jgi:hypothetical protein
MCCTRVYGAKLAAMIYGVDLLSPWASSSVVCFLGLGQIETEKEGWVGGVRLVSP